MEKKKVKISEYIPTARGMSDDRLEIVTGFLRALIRCELKLRRQLIYDEPTNDFKEALQDALAACEFTCSSRGLDFNEIDSRFERLPR